MFTSLPVSFSNWYTVMIHPRQMNFPSMLYWTKNFIINKCSSKCSECFEFFSRKNVYNMVRIIVICIQMTRKLQTYQLLLTIPLSQQQEQVTCNIWFRYSRSQETIITIIIITMVVVVNNLQNVRHCYYYIYYIYYILYIYTILLLI